MNEKRCLYKVISNLIEKQDQLVSALQYLIKAHYGDDAPMILENLENNLDWPDGYVCFSAFESIAKSNQQRRAQKMAVEKEGVSDE